MQNDAGRVDDRLKRREELIQGDALQATSQRLKCRDSLPIEDATASRIEHAAREIDLDVVRQTEV
jgi:hypothetical protein